MNLELSLIKNYLNDNQNILSIGSGIGGLELLICKKFKNSKINFIERNYISKKVKYGWDDKNIEAYNNIHFLEKFFILNGIEKNKFEIYDFDKKIFPKKKI